MRKLISWLIVSAVPFLLSGCGLMPEEEALKTPPVIHSYEAEHYEQAAVMRGNLALNIVVDCTYMAAKQEELSFALGGEYIDHVYVSEGQQVYAGDLLAELRYDNLKEEIAEKEHNLKVLQVQKEHILENKALELRRQELLLEEGDESLMEQPAVQSYEKQLQETEDALYIEQIRLNELKQDLLQRQIYAGMDGTVLYVKNTEDGACSVQGEKFVTVADISTNVFTVKGEDAQYFPTGMQETVVYKNKEYDVTVVDGSELGLTEKEQKEESAAYLCLEQPDPELEDGKRGQVEVTLEQRDDVLYVVKDAVKTANGEQLVYKLDEKGLRTMQQVVTGLETDKYIEIISGLEEGELVIIE